MKHSKKTSLLSLIATITIAVANCHLHLQAQGTAFTYQGQLANNGLPANGNYDLTFTLFPTGAGGTQATGPVTNATTTVSNGLFTVTLDFGSGVFTGNTYWLEVGVRTNGNGSFITLTPRQPITPTPYAITSENVSGTVNGSNIVGAIANSLLTTNVPIIDESWVGEPGGPNGRLLVNIDDIKLPNGMFDGGRPEGSFLNWDNSGKSVPFYRAIYPQSGLTGFGSAVGPGISSPIIWMYNYADNNVGDNAFKVLAVDSDVPSGVPVMSVNVQGLLSLSGTNTAGIQINGSKIVDSSGMLAGGRSEGSFVNWENSGSSVPFYRSIYPQSGLTGFGSAVGPGISSPIIWMYNYADNNVGDNAFKVLAVDSDVPSGVPVMSVNVRGVLNLTGQNTAGILVNGTRVVDCSGGVYAKFLTITGGSDLAEHITVSEKGLNYQLKVEPGMVVSIDSTGDRTFKLSDEPYDRKRVGIISGGNGVKPGLVLQDEGNPAVSGEQLVALTGQVWCRADATYGKITPGDLLTTSATPGHAMRVNDFSRARFAVLGQALTGLNEGCGWVQVLVCKE